MSDLSPSLVLIKALVVVCLAAAASCCRAQDVSPLKGHMVWEPMTGYSAQDIAKARASGYDTVMFKIAPSMSPAGAVDFSRSDSDLAQARENGMHAIFAILGWAALGQQYWDTNADGTKIMGRLDPFWPEAVQRVEDYFGAIIERYHSEPDVVAFAPTWGIYGEAGFTSFDAGRSEHALKRFNEWRDSQGLSPLDAIPDKSGGPNTEYNRFIRFRFLYVQKVFDQMLTRLKSRFPDKPLGMWQEMYAVVGYLWTMVRIPSADFGLGEATFSFQSTHQQQSYLGESMGFRYRCSSPKGYRDYVLPILARKHGEGQRFMGCQLSNDYAVKNYGWSEGRARRVRFDEWEDEFGPWLKDLLNVSLDTPVRDVLLVFPTYAAAALDDHPRHSVDVAILDVLLRSYGCQMRRIASPELDSLSVEEMNSFRLIVVPEASFLLSDTLERLSRTTASVLFTGAFGEALDGVQNPSGQQRSIRGVGLRYFTSEPADVSVSFKSPLTRGLSAILERRGARLPDDMVFDYTRADKNRVLLRCGGRALVSVGNGGRHIYLHGHLFASACFNPGRKPPRNISGSADASANEVDMFGPYDSAHPQNEFTLTLMKNILDYCRVDYRVPDPKPRTVTRYLGDHIEQASISANIAYNNTGRSQTLKVRTPFRPKGFQPDFKDGRFHTSITLEPYSYLVLGY